MAEVHGVAGEWARVRGTVLGLWPLFGCAVLFGFGAGLFCCGSKGLGAAVAVAALIGMVSGMSFGLRRVQSFFKGARGEEKVAGILKSLPSKYHVFNDFPVKRGYVDHVVVGPAGVFAVETKFWQGEVTVEEGCILVNGRLPSRDPLAQTYREADEVRKVLAARGWDGNVTPVLAFASDTFSAHVAEVAGTVVINSSELAAGFAGGRERLSYPEITRLVTLMEN